MIQVFASLVLLTTTGVLTPQQHAERQRIEDSLMAPCCYSQPISVHMSDAAEQMRDEVTEMVVSGMSESEIINHYKLEYGERILVVPDGTTGKTLFAIPVAAFVLCSGMLFLVLRRILRSGVRVHAVAESAVAARLREELAEQIKRETEADY